MTQRGAKSLRRFSVHVRLMPVVLAVLLATQSVAQSVEENEFHSTRIGISAGMGVNIHNAQDLVQSINVIRLGGRVDDFKSAVEFFGAVAVPFSRDWVAKAEFAYMLSSYNLSAVYGNTEVTYVVLMPTLIAQYILFEAPHYNLKVGIGAGYHFGSYEDRFFGSRYSARGIGTLVELEGNTALGEDLFAHLGVQTRWDFIGNLTNDQGKSPLGATQTNLHFFSLGARLGMTYYF